MAFTQAQIDAIEAAIATGKLTVKHGDTQVTYRSLDEMMRTLVMMKSQVSGRRRVTTAAYRGNG